MIPRISVTFLERGPQPLDRWECLAIPASGQHVAIGYHWYQVGRVQWIGPYRVEVYVTRSGEYKP